MPKDTTNHNILEERGLFWLQNKTIKNEKPLQDSAVEGVLKIGNEGLITLDLDSDLFDRSVIKDNISNNAEPFELNIGICGLLKDYRKRIYLSKITFYYSTRNFRAQNCLVGTDDFPIGCEEFKIVELRVNLKGFERWLWLDAIKYFATDEKISVTYESVKSERYDIPGAKLSIEYDISVDANMLELNNITLTQTAELVYAPILPSIMDVMKNKFHRIQDLFILLTDSEYSIEWPVLRLLENEKIYTYYFSRSRNTSPPPERHGSCINFHKTRENFGNIFSAWDEKFKIFGSAFYSYLSTRRGILIYIENRFTSLVGGIETFHRRKYPAAPISDKLSQKIQGIHDNLSNSDDKRWFKQILKRAHIAEPPLSKRILETLQAIPIDLDKQKLQFFSESCANRRNDIAHFTGQREHGDNEQFYDELNIKNEALSYLYHALLLHEIGIDKTALNAWMYESFGSYHIKEALVKAELLDKSALEFKAIETPGVI